MRHERSFHFTEDDIESSAHDDEVVWGEFNDHAASPAFCRIKCSGEVNVRGQPITNSNGLFPVLSICQSLQDGVKLAGVLVAGDERSRGRSTR